MLPNTNSVTQEFLSYADKFAMYFYQWNNRWFLSNGNCAHRIAAIYRQAKEQNRLFELTCNNTSDSFMEKLLRSC